MAATLAACLAVPLAEWKAGSTAGSMAACLAELLVEPKAVQRADLMEVSLADWMAVQTERTKAENLVG